MPVPAVPYFRLTPEEEEKLREWGFLDDYRRHHTKLIDLAKGVFISACGFLGRKPSETEFYQSYWWTLTKVNLYRNDIMGGKYYLPSSSYFYFANLLAKYVIKMDAVEITSVSC